jgi:hypothetical protein
MISHRDDNKEQLAEALRQWRLGDASSKIVSSPHKSAKSPSNTLVDLCIRAAAKALAAGNTRIFDDCGDLMIEEEFFARILQVRCLASVCSHVLFFWYTHCTTQT